MERTTKDKLGFGCGKFCAKCGEPIALDAFGRFTCFSSEHGGHVQASDGTVFAPYNPRKLKARDQSDFANEAAILSETGVRSD